MALKPNPATRDRWDALNTLNDFQQYCKDVDVYDMRILLCLFRHGNKKNQTVVGVRSGAKQCGISASTWTVRTKKLRGMGLIQYGMTEKSGYRRKYFICYAKMKEWMDETVPPCDTNRTVG